MPAGDWPSYNRTLAGDRFSPLAEINRTNVAGLTQICTYRLPEVAALQAGLAGPGVTVPMAPIAWHGLVFIGNAGGDRVGVIGHVDALDAVTGQVACPRRVQPAVQGQSIGGGIMSYLAAGRQRIGVAAGMRSPLWPGGSPSSHIILYGIR